MKLRKALEKAKKTREEVSEPDLLEEPKVETEETANEWKPPVYSHSTFIDLDNRALLENRCICIEPESMEIDCYKVLMTKLQHLTRHKGWNSVMITSALPGEGKTLTAINLALTSLKLTTKRLCWLTATCEIRILIKYWAFKARRA